MFWYTLIFLLFADGSTGISVDQTPYHDQLTCEKASLTGKVVTSKEILFEQRFCISLKDARNA